MRLFLIGLMGSGKTTIGRRLSRDTGWPYLDNDRTLREATGRSAPDLIEAEGEAALHAAEMAAFERALAAPTPVIIGVAGWIVADPEARERLATGSVVWLRAKPETLVARAGSGDGRRSDATSAAWIRRVARDRAPLFEAVADLVVDVDVLRPATVVAQILALPGVRDEPR